MFLKVIKKYLKPIFGVFYNVIKAVLKYIEISNTILQTLQYLQTLHTKSC